MGCEDTVLQRRNVKAWLGGKEEELHEHRSSLLAARHVSSDLSKNKTEVLVSTYPCPASAAFEGVIEQDELLE